MKNTLVVAIDLQYGYLSPDGDASIKLGWDNSRSEKYIKEVEFFLNEVRKNSVDICFLKMEETKETLSGNLSKDYKSNFTEICKKGTIQNDLLVKALPNERIFDKVHYSGLNNSKFRKFIESYENIVFIGTLASRCVYATMVGVSAFGYNCFYVDDLCSNPVNLQDEKDHFVRVANLFSTVLDSNTMIDRIKCSN